MAVADVAESGTPYDPKVVDAFFRALNERRLTLNHAP
jgi:HD-GYP domain-containing protein (c-di-GMP phosphodiesterase class II)